VFPRAGVFLVTVVLLRRQIKIPLNAAINRPAFLGEVWVGNTVSQLVKWGTNLDACLTESIHGDSFRLYLGCRTLLYLQG
jgi:hypothetical protein